MARLSSLLSGLVLLVLAAPAWSYSLGPFERQVLEEVNLARRNPAAYVDALREYRGFYRANFIVLPGSGVRYITSEGTVPVDEAIALLSHEAPREGLVGADTLAVAARNYVTEQAADGSVGHFGIGSTSPSDRVSRAGGGIYVSEVIAYGFETARDVVRQLIVDDGVPDRGHREVLFAPDLRYAGVACGPHPVYRTMCVIDLARTADGRRRIQMSSAQ
jgi:hypothetical protein